MTLKVEGQVKLTSDKYEFTVSDGMVARMAAAILWLSAFFIVQG